MKIGTREIGPGHPPYVIAEIGVNHDGEVQRALELTEAAARAGADAVKLQYFETDRLLSKAAKLAAYQKAAGETDPVAMLRRLELSLDEMARVVDLAHELGIHAIVTVFSVELVKPASGLAWDAYKSASPDVINRPLLEALAATGKPLIVSTGASTLDEVVRAVGWMDEIRDRLAVLQCVSCYPAPHDQLGLGGIRVLDESFSVPVGYSDHSNDASIAWGAAAFGACMLEKHITDDVSRPGPDHAASLLTSHLRAYRGIAAWGAESRSLVDQMIEKGTPEFGATNFATWLGLDPESPEGIEQGAGTEMRYAWDAVRRSSVEKRVLDCEQDVREVARQSLTTSRDMVPGETITREDLTIKRPGTGLEPFRLDEVIGKRLARDVEADTPLVEEDLAN